MVDSYEISPDIHTSYSTIENDIDNGILSNIIFDVLKSKNFKPIERLLILNLLSNGTDKDFKERENLTREKYNSIYSNAKSKIKTKLFPTYRYLLEMDNGTKHYFRNKKQLLKKIKMSQDQFDNYMSLGKTKFKKYRINIL